MPGFATTGDWTGGSCGSPRGRRSTTIGAARAAPRRAGRCRTTRCTIRSRPTRPLWAAVGALPGKQRVAVVLRHVLDRPYDEIAGVLGCSNDAARANVSAGLKTLRETMR